MMPSLNFSAQLTRMGFGTGGLQPSELCGRNGQMGVVALSTDGKHLYFTWEEELSDIWVMDVEHED